MWKKINIENADDFFIKGTLRPQTDKSVRPKPSFSYQLLRALF